MIPRLRLMVACKFRMMISVLVVPIFMMFGRLIADTHDALLKQQSR
jgi:hypothetical protein